MAERRLRLFSQRVRGAIYWSASRLTGVHSLECDLIMDTEPNSAAYRAGNNTPFTAERRARHLVVYQIGRLPRNEVWGIMGKMGLQEKIWV